MDAVAVIDGVAAFTPRHQSRRSAPVSYTLMKFLGHESMATSQRYVAGAGTENRAAAAQNPLYGLID